MGDIISPQGSCLVLCYRLQGILNFTDVACCQSTTQRAPISTCKGKHRNKNNDFRHKEMSVHVEDDFKLFFLNFYSLTWEL